MNKKFEDELTALTCGEVAQRMMDAVYVEMGYNDPPPDQSRTDLVKETEAAKRALYRLLPKNFFSLRGLKLKWIHNDKNDLELRFELRKNHPYNYEYLRWDMRNFIVPVFKLKRKNMLLGDGKSKDLVLHKVEPLTGTASDAFVASVVAQIESQLHYQTYLRESADRLQLLIEEKGEAEVQQLLADVSKVGSLMQKHIPSILDIKSFNNLRNERLSRIVAAVEQGRPAPAGLRRFCQQKLGEEVTVNG